MINTKPTIHFLNINENENCGEMHFNSSPNSITVKLQSSAVNLNQFDSAPLTLKSGTELNTDTEHQNKW